jgi:hypothetical protein
VPSIGILQVVSKLLKYLDVLVVLLQFILGHLYGGHESSVSACPLVVLRVVIIKLPELGRAQSRTSVLIANYPTKCSLRRRRQCTRTTSLIRKGAPCQPGLMHAYKGWPPRVPSDLGPQHFFFLVVFGLFLVTAHFQLLYI